MEFQARRARQFSLMQPRLCPLETGEHDAAEIMGSV